MSTIHRSPPVRGLVPQRTAQEAPEQAASAQHRLTGTSTGPTRRASQVGSQARTPQPGQPAAASARLTAVGDGPVHADPAAAHRSPALKFDARLRNESRACWDAIGTAEFNLWQAFGGRRPRAENNPATAKLLEEFKRQRDDRAHPTDVSASDGYQTLMKVEIDDETAPRTESKLEELLPADSKFRQMLDPFTGAIRDPRTGLYAELHQSRDGKYQLCFPGTGAGNMVMKHYAADIAQFVGKGKVPAMYRLGAELTGELNSLLRPGTFVVTGHSMGGGIANYAGLRHGVRSYCYNAAALGGACIRELQKDGLLTDDRVRKQTHIRIKGDVVSSAKTQQRLAATLLVQGVRIQPPRLVGQVCVIDHTVNGYNGKLGPLDRHLMTAFDDVYTNRQAAVHGGPPG